jgi:predicted ATPase
LACRACFEWLKGYPDSAKKTGEESIVYARQLDHPNSLAYALCYGGATPAAFRREPAAVAETASELIELSEKEGFPLRLTVGTVFKGWSLAHVGCVEEGISMMRKALADLEGAGQNYARTLYVALLVDASIASGMAKKALPSLDKAFGLVENSGERWCEAELHRLGGRYLTMASGNTEETETRYRSALRIARKQGAKSLELRAATSLSRLLYEQTKRQEARDLLAPVYEWFTEGFDTPDLKDARELLDDLD